LKIPKRKCLNQMKNSIAKIAQIQKDFNILLMIIAYLLHKEKQYKELFQVEIYIILKWNGINKIISLLVVIQVNSQKKRKRISVLMLLRNQVVQQLVRIFLRRRQNIFRDKLWNLKIHKVNKNNINKLSK